MLGFLKKTKQQLLAANRFKRYLIYAIGEIFLVVIGILFALQINNWNEDKKSKIRQSKYLSLVKSEMSNNLEALQDEKQNVTNVLEGLREIIQFGDKPSDQTTDEQLSNSWGKAFSKTIIFQYENGALTELISSGVLKEIQNDSIRNILASWEGKMQKVLTQENAVNSYLQKGNDYLEVHGNVRGIIDENLAHRWWRIDKLPNKQSNKFLLDSKEFENIVVFAVGTAQALNDSRYSLMEEEIKSLIDLIDQELEK